MKSISELQSITCHMGFTISRADECTCPLTPDKQASTRFTYSGGMEG